MQYCKLTLKITEKGSHFQDGSHHQVGSNPGEGTQGRLPGVETGMG